MNEDIDDLDEEIDGDNDGQSGKPESSKPWLDAITEAELALADWQTKCDSIDKLYASLSRLANTDRAREFQLFWANVQVIGPSIYSRPPVPVVTTLFKDRDPVAQVASEMLERSSISAFGAEDINGVMKLVRDDLVRSARGQTWLRYETKTQKSSLKERVCIEHADRKDFLHEPARKWKEVGWVAKRSWLTKREMRKRFYPTSGMVFANAAYEVRKDDRDNGAATRGVKAGVWEIWSKTENKVVWVTEGVDVVLDSGKPHLELEGFFPCPEPAFSTTQPRSLVPVPDFMFYKDQLEEINDLTARIGALTEAVRVRGFYPAGAGEIGDAVQAAVKNQSDNQILIPISNWAAFGNTTQVIIWLPIEVITNTIAQLVSLRTQVISDVYEITGLSDIMRGASDPNETLGAQELKSQYGSVRVRDRQGELVRIARDTTRLMAEIMAENFQSKTFLSMSQLRIPSDADVAEKKQPIEAQIKQITSQLAEAQNNPQVMQAAEQNPEQAKQVVQQAQQGLQQARDQLAKLDETVTMERVMGLLRDQRVRPFVLDIETDSTIQPDENAEKQRRGEFVGVLGTMMTQLSALVAQQPSAAKFAGAILKFAVAPYRAGRELDGSIDEFLEGLQTQVGQDKPNPEQERVKAEMEMKQQEMQGRQQELQMKGQIAQADAQAKMQAAAADMQIKQADQKLKLEEIQVKMQAEAQTHELAMQKGALELEKLRLEIQRLGGQIEAQAQAAQIEAMTPEVLEVF